MTYRAEEQTSAVPLRPGYVVVMSTAARIEELLALPDDERAEIASALVDSIGGPGQPLAPGESWEDAWLPEINRRLQALENGTAKTIPMEEVLQKLKKKLGSR